MYHIYIYLYWGEKTTARKKVPKCGNEIITWPLHLMDLSLTLFISVPNKSLSLFYVILIISFTHFPIVLCCKIMTFFMCYFFMQMSVCILLCFCFFIKGILCMRRYSILDWAKVVCSDQLKPFL